MGKVITIGAWKGGVGKTTLIYLLTTISKKKILIIDFDSQCNLTQSFIKTSNSENNILHDPIALKTNYENIDIISGNILMMNTLWKDSFNILIKKYQNDYDYIVCDIPANLIIQGFKYSDQVYLVTDGSMMSYAGLVTIIKQYNSAVNKTNNITGIILNNLNRFKETKDLIEAINNSNLTKDLVIEPYIYKRSSINRAMLNRQPITKMRDGIARMYLDELSKKIFG